MKIQLKNALRAGYTFFYCQTFEMNRAIENILIDINSIEQRDWETEIWDFEQDNNPDKVLELLSSCKPYTVIIAKNFNWFMSEKLAKPNYEAMQFIQNKFSEFSSIDCRKALIIISDENFNSAIPSCLKKEFITINFDLPDEKEISEILNEIIEVSKENPKFKMPSEKDKQELIESALGLTKRSVSNAFAYSLVQGEGKIDAKIVSGIRSSEINETSGLTVANYDKIDIKGYSKAKKFIKMSINNPNSKGVLLLGPPGVGKTQLARWTSSISSKIMIEFELANVQGQGLYGQAEAEMRNAIEVIRSIGNCVLFIDEIEKAIPGKNSSADSTGTRSFGQLLKFLSDDRPQGCFVIATCNNIQNLPPEWVRSGRFDVIFFSDLPGIEEKEQIYKYYLEKYDVKSGGFSANDMVDWSGAEIETACRIASMTNSTVIDAKDYVTPISKTMKEDIDYLRKWAKDRTIPANDIIKKTKRIRQLDV